MKIGAQLYTLRDFCQDLPSFAQTLKRVADIGYTTVQVSGTCAFDPQWLKEELDKNGLKCVITHVDGQKMMDDAAKVCADHRVFGCKNIGLGHYGFRVDDVGPVYEEFLATYLPVAKAIKANGGYFMFHHHDGEFQHYQGKTIIRKMAEDFAPDELGFTLDTFWVQAGGASPAEYLRELKGRVPCIHLKDFIYDRKYAPVGEGNINFETVIAAAEDAGTQYLLVEQDECFGEDPFDCLTRSYRNLKAMGLD